MQHGIVLGNALSNKSAYFRLFHQLLIVLKFNKKQAKLFNMKKIQFIFCSFLLTVFSCGEDFFEQVVEIDLPEHTPALAVTAIFTDVDTSLTVYVSNSVGILEPDQPAIIENATVELFKNDQLLHSFDYIGNGLYGKIGIQPLGDNPANYVLKVDAPDYDQISASQSMPQPVPLIDASFEREGTVTPDGDRVNNVSITFIDPGGIANYYSVSAVGRISEGGFDYSDMVYLSSFNPIVEEGEEILVFSDATFDGREITLNFYTYNDYPDSAESVELDINLISISNDRYFFEKSLNIYNNSNGNPFVEPVVVHSNIENGHGIFTTESHSLFTLKIL
jgi:hypothetical protein